MVAAIQDVTGVRMVDINVLDRPPPERGSGSASVPGYPGFLPSDAPRPLQDASTVDPAELLLVGEDVQLTVLS